MDDENSILEFASPKSTVPEVTNQLLSEFENHVRSRMRQWPTYADHSSLTDAHIRLPMPVATSLRGAPTESSKTWKRVANAASHCVRNEIFKHDLKEFRINEETIGDLYRNILRSRGQYTMQKEEEVDDLREAQAKIVGKECFSLGLEFMADKDRFEKVFNKWLTRTFGRQRAVAALGVEPTASVVQTIFDSHANLQSHQRQGQYISSDTQTNLENQSMDHVLALAWDLDKAYEGTRHQEMERPNLHHWNSEHDEGVYAGSSKSEVEGDAMDIDSSEDIVCSRYDTGSKKRKPEEHDTWADPRSSQRVRTSAWSLPPF